MKTSKSLFTTPLILCFLFSFKLLAQDPLVIDQKGNVGIGITNPGNYKLNVNGSLKANSGVFKGALIADSLKLPELYSGWTEWKKVFVKFERGVDNDQYRGKVNFYAPTAYKGASRPALTLMGNYGNGGKVGIGTTEPLALLHLNIESSDFATAIFGKGSDANFKIVAFQDRTSNANGALVGGFGLDYSKGTKNAMIKFYRGGSSTGGFIAFTTNNDTERMRINKDGNIGIGTNNPTKAKLEVQGNVNYSLEGVTPVLTNVPFIGTEVYVVEKNAKINASYKYSIDIKRTSNSLFSTKSVIQINKNEKSISGGSHRTSIFASEDILAKGFIAYSDARIKNIHGLSDSQKDLALIKNIEITDYQMKDVIARGYRPYKKVIAQQVKKIYPQAVSVSTDVVPDIYRNATIKNGWVNLSTDLKLGEEVQLIFGSEKVLFKVLENNKTGFKVDTEREGEVFVFGRQVDDFHSVDYEAISMLHVSATQELARKVEQLEKEKAELQNNFNKLNDRLNKIEASLQQ